jgi:peptidoglycan/LPS O-acetylase OafA/YrhL
MASAYEDRTRTRIPELDCLRGIAILLVLGRHILFIPDELPLFSKHLLLAWREVGWIGVDLFFVLSGFLVSGILFAEYQERGTVSITRFLIRRALRIYPPFYLLLIFSIPTALYFEIPRPLSIRALIGEIFFLQNYIGPLWDQTWSLAVEEHFYLLLASIIFVLLRSHSKRKNPFSFIQQMIGVVACMLLLLRVLMSYSCPVGDSTSTFGYSHLRIDSLFMGVYLAYLFHFQREALTIFVTRFRFLLLPFGLSTVLVPLLFPLTESRFSYSFGFTWLYLGFAAVLLWCIYSQMIIRNRLVKYLTPLARIGRNSYSIYLWHMMVYALTALIWSPNAGLYTFYFQTTAYMMGSILVGSIMANIVEVPTLRFRERYFR